MRSGSARGPLISPGCFRFARAMKKARIRAFEKFRGFRRVIYCGA
jgi:hypothetical protein